jgi:hypothetical protein
MRTPAKDREPGRRVQLFYPAFLTECRVKDEAVQARQPLRRERVRNSLEAILGFPVFVYGSAVNGLSCLTPRRLARRLPRIGLIPLATSAVLTGLMSSKMEAW